MSTREKTLAFVVGAMVAIIVTMMLAKVIMRHRSQLTEQLATKQRQLLEAETNISERDTWVQRDQWLSQNLKPAGPRPGNVLLDDVTAIAAKHSIVVATKDVGTLRPDQFYQEVAIHFEVTAKWEDLVQFLFELQSPTNFLVFKTCDVEIDKTDKTQVHSKIQLARWFAPK